nr:PAAR domain-containing protein [Rhodoferax sp.]
MFNAANQAAIRLGDATSHGGKVTSATTRYVLHGIAVAQEGDMTHC